MSLLKLFYKLELHHLPENLKGIVLKSQFIQIRKGRNSHKKTTFGAINLD